MGKTIPCLCEISSKSQRFPIFIIRSEVLWFANSRPRACAGLSASSSFSNRSALLGNRGIVSRCEMPQTSLRRCAASRRLESFGGLVGGRLLELRGNDWAGGATEGLDWRGFGVGLGGADWVSGGRGSFLFDPWLGAGARAGTVYSYPNILSIWLFPDNPRTGYYAPETIHPRPRTGRFIRSRQRQRGGATSNIDGQTGSLQTGQARRPRINSRICRFQFLFFMKKGRCTSAARLRMPDDELNYI